MRNHRFTFLGAVLAIGAALIFATAPTTHAASDQGFNGTTAKTAAYTVTAAENGTVFTNRAATASVTFTLPAPFANAHYLFIAHAGQNLLVAADVVDTLVTFNDATADSLDISTTSEKIGSAILVWSDGTSWFAIGITKQTTYTVTT